MNNLNRSLASAHRQLKSAQDQLRALSRKLTPRPSIEQLLAQGHTWEPWYAWHPKRVHGRWYWRTQLYRIKGNTYVDYDNWAWYYYGTLFDTLK